MKSESQQLSEYDTKMIQQFQKLVSNDTLTLDNEENVSSLSFIPKLNVTELTIIDIEIIPKLTDDGIKKLSIYHCNLQSIDGLELKNLEVLQLYGNNIKSIKTIVGYQNLKELVLSHNTKIDIAPLQYMVQLTSLNLKQCKLKDISILQFLVNLKVLDLSFNKNINIDPLKYQVQLSDLKLNICALNDMSPISQLHNLKVLEIAGNKLENIYAIQNLVNLISLNVGENKLKDISILKKFPNLKEIVLNHNEGVDIAPLSRLPQLTKIGLHSCQLQSIQVLTQLVNLEDLTISGNTNIDISPLKYFQKLRCLNMSEIAVKNIQVLRYLTNLQKLDCSYNQGLDITPIQFLVQLNELYIHNCDIHSIYQLRPLVNLEKCLELSRNCITDISPLEHLTKLQMIYLSYNKIIDFNTVMNHPTYHLLDQESQEFPTIVEQAFVKRMMQVDSLNIMHQKLGRCLKPVVEHYSESKQRVNSLIKKQFTNQIQFVNLVAKVFLTLNSVDFQ
ncbi:leucine-rich_repeat domain-containing protein [Hexamita inflata]|uniref:Leucine-rich repeat domain-containing protein n=1 Tax=Hexamita inflata TaxID=28002 RepID=A0AA86U3A0_9EUKA|nr:leucine-rich repeat domain-containing protein [Hexamita inflata]